MDAALHCCLFLANNVQRCVTTLVQHLCMHLLPWLITAHKEALPLLVDHRSARFTQWI
jgi:hypothetical protein